MIAAQILAPVVMISACAIMLNGLILHYNSLGERVRVIHKERLTLMNSAVNQNQISDEQLSELNYIIQDLLKHHHQVHTVLLLIYLSILIFIFDMLIIALEISTPSLWLNQSVIVIFLLGIAVLFYSIVLIAIELSSSHNSIQLEAHRNCSLCKKTNKLRSHSPLHD